MKTFAITDVGQARDMNQDYMFASENPIGNLPNLFVVADGMGGHNAGDVASRLAIETLVRWILEHTEETNPLIIFQKAIEEVNGELLELSQNNEQLQGMGTTMVAAVLDGDILYVANVGDSRLYVVEEDIKQITRDHSLVEEMVRRGELSKEEARNHPNKNIITRAIGTSAQIAVDCFEEKITKGTTILLCSDGLTNMIEDTGIFSIITEAPDLETAGKRLVAVSNLNGGKDNITVVLANLD